MESLANNVTNQSDMQGWEYRQVSVTRVPGYGFGIAVSGGRDNPHFSSGDPSIAVSDVLAQGPAERLLQVNDRILSVNGISLQNVDYATAVQVLRDSGDTVILSVKRRVIQTLGNHQHSHSLSASFGATSPLTGPQNVKVTLTKNSKKEDFGIVLGCKLFIKEISTKARDQLATTNQMLVEGDFVTKVNNTNCNDIMSLKEAKKIIDSCKDKLNIVVTRDSGINNLPSHQAQSSISTTGAVNNYYHKGDREDSFLSNQSYSNQNLYVQPPTRHSQQPSHSTTYFDDSTALQNGISMSPDDKNNLAPRSGGRLRGPINDANLSRELEAAVNNHKGRQMREQREPPRPPPPRPEDYYSSRRQLYEEDPLLGKNKQSVPDARFIAFQKEGSVGIRLTGGNHSGIFVTAVQPGSPASLQGLQPGDKILKVNDMDMTGVTREEAVLFLLSLQDRIELIVQFCKDEYDAVVASQKGDSFYIKTHFHYESPVKGEMTFRSGDIFHVIDTLYNGVVGCWQVFRIGRNNQEVQKGIIPNKARAEELATAQFNATKKEMSASESRGSFFRRRRSSSRRSKSLGKEHWDDILFSDSVSKFPAYERVVLKHPGFMRPVILFGPIADVARDKLLKDFPDKFISPQLESGLDDNKSQKSSHIIRLSAIRDVISTGKHALLDITPNAVERLNYAQLYPIVVFLKADTKMVIKQLRQGLPKSAHKSSKKLLEHCARLDKVWSHVFGATITLSDSSEHWYRKLREILDRQQASALWMSETKPEESLSDDFLFPMSSLRLSYASSPESDLEHSPSPTGTMPPGQSGTGIGTGLLPQTRLTKASSDPSVAMVDPPTDHGSADVPPPYQASYDSKYGFASTNQQNESEHMGNLKEKSGNNNIQDQSYNKNSIYGQNSNINNSNNDFQIKNEISHERQKSNLHSSQIMGSYSKSLGSRLLDSSGRENSPSKSPRDQGGFCVPDLPPRVDRAAKPSNVTGKGTVGRSAHERLFGTKPPSQNSDNIGDQSHSGTFVNSKGSSLERRQDCSKLVSYDSMSSYDSYNNHSSPISKQTNQTPRLGPNAHDDLKSSIPQSSDLKHDHSTSQSHKYPSHQWSDQTSHEKYASSKYSKNYETAEQVGGNNQHNGDNYEMHHSPRNSIEMDSNADRRLGKLSSPRTPDGRPGDNYRYNRSPGKSVSNRLHFETKTDYGKYSRNNTSQEFIRKSQLDLNGPSFSVPQSQGNSILTTAPSMQHLSNGGSHALPPPPPVGINSNTYKPIPPPKPKNYKPPLKNSQTNFGFGDDLGSPTNNMSMSYQHGKSNSHPSHLAEQRSPNYYYNIPPAAGTWHGDGTHFAQPIGGNGGSPYEHRHSGGYDIRGTETRMAGDGMHYTQNGQDFRDHGDNRYNSGENGLLLDYRSHETRNNIVDLQGSREQRGSAFELYRKPMHHNMR